MTKIMKLTIMVAGIILCTSSLIADEVSISNTTSSGITSPTNANPPYSSGPELPPIGQNCHTEKVCVSVSCNAYDNQGKCINQVCVAWEYRFVCK